MSGFSDSFQEQIAALEATSASVLNRIPVQEWSFGGGTALAKTRDIVDIGLALTQYPGILKELVNQNAVTLNELFEWREMLIEVD